MKGSATDRYVIDGKHVDLVYKTVKSSVLKPGKEGLKEIIRSELRSGRESGKATLAFSEESMIMAEWQVVFEEKDIVPDIKIRFSTSGKYNAGMRTTERYEGIISKVENEKAWVKIGSKVAVIQLKHIERIL